ncbi:MAG: elongation factor G [Actinobacteria bacterium]|nr:elongation factor G [Actinomycetota bacterium]
MSKDLTVPTERIRNVVLLGHTGGGKTTLAEAMLLAAGVTTRLGSTADGTTKLDFEPEEQDKHHSLSLALAAVPWSGHKINILDAPGGPESYGDAFPALAAADIAIFVVDATAGVQAQHDELWQACDQLDLPRLVFLNKLDNENAQFQTNVDALSERYGKKFAPVMMPLGVEAELTGVIDLLHDMAVRFDGDVRTETEVPDERKEQAARNRELLVEAIVETDDELLMEYLEGEIPETKRLAEQFAHGIAEAEFFPMLCGSAEKGIGIQLLLDFLIEECPSPTDRGPIQGTQGELPLDAPTTAYVAKTLSDPFVGRINLLRVLAGGLANDDHLLDARTGKDSRLHGIFTLQGKEQIAVASASAGDLVAIAKLDDVSTGDVLTAKGHEFAFDAPRPPEGYYRVALSPASAGDEDKLSTALQRIAEEDPSLRVERDEDTGALVLHSYGPTHVDVTLRRMHRKFGVDVNQSPPPVAYRETLKGRGQGVGKHVKQSGGHGQYGVAHIEVEPLPSGGGFEFDDAIVGGVIPNQFIPSVEKGVLQALDKGPLAGYPVVDVKVKLYDGKHHSVDSSDAAFQMAGILAFREAANAAGVKLLEPIMEIDIVVPDDHTGTVMGDLSSRRGRILGTDAAGAGKQVVHALVPESEVLTYAAELRALTSGQGTLAMSYHHHEDVPDNVAQRIIAAHQESDG